MPSGRGISLIFSGTIWDFRESNILLINLLWIVLGGSIIPFSNLSLFSRSFLALTFFSSYGLLLYSYIYAWTHLVAGAKYLGSTPLMALFYSDLEKLLKPSLNEFTCDLSSSFWWVGDDIWESAGSCFLYKLFSSILIFLASFFV